MKSLIDKISESGNAGHVKNGSSFSEEVKYSKSDWEKWKKETKEDVLIGNYESEPNLELVYIPNHKEKTMDHIATYNKTAQILFCDDIKLFGHEEQ